MDAVFPSLRDRKYNNQRVQYSSKGITSIPRAFIDRKDHMRSLLNWCLVLFLTGTLASAQSPANKAKPSTHASANLPSEATVDSFLQQSFGYQEGLTWKISSIK